VLAFATVGPCPEPRRLDDILQSHLIDPALLRTDRFEAFVRDRAVRLLDLIEEATGRPVAGRDSDEVREVFGGPLSRKESAGRGA
jgi:hypothetical protein